MFTIAIFIMASLFRLSNLNLIEFKSDEATTVLQTIQFFNHPQIIQYGQLSSIGVYNFPLFNYLMIPLGVFSLNPQILSFSIGLLGSIAVCLYFLIVRKYFNFKTAVFSALLLATSPWAVLYSRKIWAQDFILILLIPALYFLFRIIYDRSRYASFFLFFLLTLLAQLHASGIFLFLVFLPLLYLVKAKIDLKLTIIGVVVGSLALLPYFYHEASSRPPCPDCLSFLAYKKTIRPRDLENFVRPLQISTGLYFQFELGKDYQSFVGSFPFNYIFYAEAFLLLAALVLVKEKFLILPIILIPILYYLTRTHSFIHYYIITLPFIFLVLALSLTKWRIGPFILTLFIANNILFMVAFNNFLGFKKQIDGDYGPIFSITQDQVDLQISQYSDLAYFEQLRNYSLSIDASSNETVLHQSLAEFFKQKGRMDLAKDEMEKASQQF